MAITHMAYSLWSNMPAAVQLKYLQDHHLEIKGYTQEFPGGTVQTVDFTRCTKHLDKMADVIFSVIQDRTYSFADAEHVIEGLRVRLDALKHDPLFKIN